jgi:uncharacterized integral membrane protein (TIGR00697 family)
VGKQIWLRATGSTLVSQLIDSFVVLYIAFYWGSDWTLVTVLAVGTINYLYKSLVAIILTPMLYVMHGVIDSFLGREHAERMIAQAASES